MVDDDLPGSPVLPSRYRTRERELRQHRLELALIRRPDVHRRPERCFGVGVGVGVGLCVVYWGVWACMGARRVGGQRADKLVVAPGQ